MAIKRTKLVLSDAERRAALAELEALFAAPTPRAEVQKRAAAPAKPAAAPTPWTEEDDRWQVTQGVTWIQQQVCLCCGRITNAIAGELLEYRNRRTGALRQVRRTRPLPEGTRIRLEVAQIQVEKCFDCLHLEAVVEEGLERIPEFNILNIFGGKDVRH